ncbi:MAG: ATP-binding cassette domain-containing protein [Kofleriaceae bacterium]|nr:ATP-binding cassette domain-containing protein [Kofleriaceae bacterium]
MISTANLSLQFSSRVLFENVSIKFTPGNCYGLIGANGAGKSTFVKILSGEIDPTEGEVLIPGGMRMSVLKQDHFEYDDVPSLSAVLMGHKRLFQIMKEKEIIYAKEDFSEADGIRSAELESEFDDLNGWESESQAAELLSGLGMAVKYQKLNMGELDDGNKVRVLLAQALFADPDILLLDEPTNHLDVDNILWLEKFLANFKNTVIVVSHDRHFLNHVCTHIADIDYQKVTLYSGNYDFWQQSSELALSQQRDSNKKSEDKAKELKSFIQRFSANASKSKQATARKKMLANLSIDQIRPSTRKYPHIVFAPEKLQGKDLLTIKNLSKSEGGEVLFKDLNMTIAKDDRVVFVSEDSLATTALLAILGGTLEPDTGSVNWGSSVKHSYFPKDHNDYFHEVDLNLIDWLRQFSDDEKEEFVRSFLGRMLFTGEESKKKAKVLSGGEKVRCMLSKLMLEEPQCMVLDGPTNHLDLESITSLNRALIKYPGTVLFASHDVEFIQSLANRVVEIGPNGVIDRPIQYEDYLAERAERQEAQKLAKK